MNVEPFDWEHRTKGKARHGYDRRRQEGIPKGDHLDDGHSEYGRAKHETSAALKVPPPKTDECDWCHHESCHRCNGDRSSEHEWIEQEKRESLSVCEVRRRKAVVQHRDVGYGAQIRAEQTQTQDAT